uniref:NtA domain-containing protein n=1 Tax=Elaeophora elaphi TaxID=1147741 RepID=A0A0R3RIR0_9BILA
MTILIQLLLLLSLIVGILSSHKSYDSCLFDPAKFNESLQHAPIVISATVLDVTVDPRDSQLQIFTLLLVKPLAFHFDSTSPTNPHLYFLYAKSEVINLTCAIHNNYLLRYLQTATVRVKRIFKGSNIINGRKKIAIYGLGNIQICRSILHERDTKIILLNELNGLFYLNSSLVPINLNILDQLNARFQVFKTNEWQKWNENENKTEILILKLTLVGPNSQHLNYEKK